MSEAIRLMVVDDHSVLREGLKFMLRSIDDVLIVGEAADGLEALALVDEAKPDVILLDLQMPNLDGLSTLRHLNETNPEAKVLIFSVYDDPEYVEEALRQGASGYLLKSVSPDELMRAVRAVAEGSGYLQAEITGPVLRRFSATAPPDLDVKLSPRETEVLTAVSEGMSSKQVATKLGISEPTVKTYLRQLFEKLGATHRAHAVALALRHRLID